MGASAWFHLVPYRADVSTALDALRWDVFRSGDYAKGYAASTALPSFDDWIAQLPRDYVGDMEDPRAEYDALARQVSLDPKTPDEAVEKAAEDGTHSVLDVTRVSASPAFGAVSPMPEDVQRDLFGSARPGRARVEAAQHAIGCPAGRWSGYWLAVYADDDDAPRWLCFAGVSGD
jgi:hypothetical protein